MAPRFGTGIGCRYTPDRLEQSASASSHDRYQDHCRRVWLTRHGHGFARGPGCAAHRADRPSHRAPEDPRKGSSQPARFAHDGGTPSATPRLSASAERRAVSQRYRPTRAPTLRKAAFGPLLVVSWVDTKTGVCSSVASCHLSGPIRKLPEM